MTDAREILAGARFFDPGTRREKKFGKKRANEALAALATAGIRLAGPDDRILGPAEVDPVTVEKCAEVTERMLRFADTTSEADIAISEAVRALGRKA